MTHKEPENDQTFHYEWAGFRDLPFQSCINLEAMITITYDSGLVKDSNYRAQAYVRQGAK